MSKRGKALFVILDTPGGYEFAITDPELNKDPLFLANMLDRVSVRMAQKAKEIRKQAGSKVTLH